MNEMMKNMYNQKDVKPVDEKNKNKISKEYVD